eukprot:2093496-Rhodomonas_salina.1
MQKGYAGQSCVECPDGFFILNSTSSNFHCQKCPPSANCPDKGPPVFSRLVRGSVVASSASRTGEWTNNDLKSSMASMLAARLELGAFMISFTAKCDSTDSVCNSQLLRRADTAAEDSWIWVLSFFVYLPRNEARNLDSEVAAMEDLVADSVRRAFKAENLNVSAVAQLDPASKTDDLDGWEFVLSDTGEVRVIPRCKQSP